MANLQPWSCPGCGREGSVTYETGASHTRVIDAIANDHQKKSPDCPGSPEGIRVHQPITDPRRTDT